MIILRRQKWNWPFLQHIQMYVPPVTLSWPDPIVSKLRRSVKPDNHFAAVAPSHNTVWLMHKKYTRADQEKVWLMICTPCFQPVVTAPFKVETLTPMPLILWQIPPTPSNRSSTFFNCKHITLTGLVIVVGQLLSYMPACRVANSQLKAIHVTMTNHVHQITAASLFIVQHDAYDIYK